MMGVRAAWLLLLLALGAATGSPPSPAGTKRSIEDIQFGNQQNPPVSLLDDNALPGAFPSSETSEENVSGKEGTGEPLELQQQQHRQQIEQQQQEEQDQQEDTQQDDTQKDDLDRSMIPAAEANSWNKASSPRLHLYQPRWDMPLMIGGATYPTRLRRSVQHRVTRPDPRKVPQVSLKVLRAGQRHKRDLRRYRRDLGTNVDLEKLLADVDVMELLAMLARNPHHNQGGFGTITYAPAPPRYAPQPKLFPDYDNEDDRSDEGAMGLLRQNERANHLPEAVIVPAGRQMYRRSGGYSLSSVPGFKRSAFRANKPRPHPPQALNQRDVYSLAAMLGAELDPVTHRLRRVAM